METHVHLHFLLLTFLKSVQKLHYIWTTAELQEMIKGIRVLDGNHSCSSRSRPFESKSWWWTWEEELLWTGSLIWRYCEEKKTWIYQKCVVFFPRIWIIVLRVWIHPELSVFPAHLLTNSLNGSPNWKRWRWVLRPERPPVSTATHLFPKWWPATRSLLHPSTKRLAQEAWTQGNNSRKGWIQNTTQPFFLRLLLHPSTSSSVWVCRAASCGS